MINSILELYKERFSFDKFYDNLLYNISTWSHDHIRSETFLNGYEYRFSERGKYENILTKSGDIRVDLPVWFGDYKAFNRMAIIGMEPRDTNKQGRFNIERVGDYVFGTPFALERPGGPYHSAFADIIGENSNTFVYFTDVVKTYHVSGDKQTDDGLARQIFSKNADQAKCFLLEELAIIKPSMVIALGNDSHKFLTGLLGNTYNIHKVRHPSYGGALEAKKDLMKLVC